MKTYIIRVTSNQEWVDVTLAINAETEEQAKSKALEYVPTMDMFDATDWHVRLVCVCDDDIVVVSVNYE